MFICPGCLIRYDFWTGNRFKGGQTIKTDAPFDKIPLLVKAGSIVPMGPFVQYTGEDPGDILEIRIYAGANGEFTLYEDEGDNYNYEKGAYSIITFTWDDLKKPCLSATGTARSSECSQRENSTLLRLRKTGEQE